MHIPSRQPKYVVLILRNLKGSIYRRALALPGLGHVALEAAARDLTDVGGRLPDIGRLADAADVAVDLVVVAMYRHLLAAVNQKGREM
jgi:hypothetical protein